MKIRKKLVTVLMMFVLFFSVCSISIYAADSKEIENTNTILLETANIQGHKTDTGYEYTCDLLQEKPSESSDTKAIGWIKVGNAKFRLTLMPGNGIGYADWSFTLNNGDFIKRVTGTLVVEKDILGPVNPNYASCEVSESYLGTLYKTATGSESFSFPSDVSNSQNIIFKWSGFKINGVTGDYSVTNGNKQGKVSDFK